MALTRWTSVIETHGLPLHRNKVVVLGAAMTTSAWGTVWTPNRKQSCYDPEKQQRRESNNTSPQQTSTHTHRCDRTNTNANKRGGNNPDRYRLAKCDVRFHARMKTPNAPKLSDGKAVRCSAWLGVIGVGFS
jgi:hypothetical protein